MTSSDDSASARREQMYNRGATTFFSAKIDPRFSYTLYVPPTVGPETTVLVAVHGTGRRVWENRDVFSEFGRLPVDKILLYGFSGGGHFTHRFLYLHPDRLRAASIGAPGSVTLPDDRSDYWVGCRNLEEVFGIALNPDAIMKVPVHLVVGGADRESWEITHKPGGKNWMENANMAGETRVDRIQTLEAALRGLGVKTRLDIMPGVSHDSVAASNRTRDFFLDVLKGRFEAD
jgi:pimeloyl-ACP methyl ester carboxylesterase